MRIAVRSTLTVVALASVLWCGSADAAPVMIIGSGVWDEMTETSALTTANASFRFGFEIDDAASFGPRTDFSRFSYVLDGRSIQAVPSEITFFADDAGGGFQMNFASGAFLSGFGASLLAPDDTLRPVSGLPFQFVTNGNSFAVGTLAVASPVPEPSTWLMMIVGFAVTGTTLRGSIVRRVRSSALA